MRGMMRWTGALVAALVMAACAGNPGARDTGGDGEDVVRIRVQNDGAIPTQVRVYLVPVSGAEIQVGAMTTLGAETLTARAPVIRGRYVLRAEGGTSSRLTSPSIQLRDGDTIIWDMRLNQVRMER